MTEDQKRIQKLEACITGLILDLRVIHENGDQVPFDIDWYAASANAVEELGINIPEHKSQILPFGDLYKIVILYFP